MRAWERSHVARVVFYVAVIQDRIQSTALLLLPIVGPLKFGRQSMLRRKSLLRRREFARFYDVFDSVLNRAAFIICVVVLVFLFLACLIVVEKQPCCGPREYRRQYFQLYCGI